jgi:hypothetical protein
MSLAPYRWLLAVALLGGCPRRAPPPPPPTGPLCRQVRVARLPARDPNGRWGVELDVQGPVLAAHEARFRRRGITPNGEAWAGLFEQCLPRAELDGVQLDPEAGSLHAWVATDAAKDRWVAAVCRAVDDAAWLDRCLASVDRDQLDD